MSYMAFLPALSATLQPPSSNSSDGTNLSPRLPPVPPSPAKAAKQISASVRTALLNGQRRLQVDVLAAAIDPRARTYDADSAQTIFTALLTALRPVRPLRVVVSGATAALRVRAWLDAAAEDGDGAADVSVSVMGMEKYDGSEWGGEEDVDDDTDEENKVSSLLIMDPPGTGQAITDLRKLLSRAHVANCAVVIHNHPRESALYAMLGYGGAIPYEMFRYEFAFALVPFALQEKEPADEAGTGGSVSGAGAGGTPPPRFVLMRQYPHAWQLWRYLGDEGTGMGNAIFSGSTAGGEQQVENEQEELYVLVEEFAERPSDNAVLSAITKML